jgi:hypothetical protein
MSDKTVKDALIDQIEKLPHELQVKVLDFAKHLQPDALKGVKGKKLLQFEGAIDFEDLELMEKAIDEGCESVDTNGW